MKIGLMGFSFSHENKGCEALTYSILGILSKCVNEKKIEIVNFSSYQNFGEVPNSFPEFNYQYCPLKLKDKKLRFLKAVNECDFIFDETFGDGFADIYFSKPVYRDTLLKSIIGRSHTKYIMTPQTYGPFKDKKLERFAGNAIKKADFVFARDQISGDYAEQISKRKVITVTDLAFALPYDIVNTTNRKNDFGINVSGLLWKGGFNKKNQFGLTITYKKYCQDLIEYLLKETDYNIHLIPHVTICNDKNKNIPDSDSEACIELKKLFDKEDRVILAPDFINPIDAKNYIAKMKFFLGARMHSTIAAFSTGVITIPLSYSRKFQGLYNNLEYPYVLDACKMNQNEILKITIDWIKHYHLLDTAREKSMIHINSKLEKFQADLYTIVNQKD